MTHLAKLPFPIEELAWEKFAEVRQAMQLSACDTKRLMAMVLGQPSADVAW